MRPPRKQGQPRPLWNFRPTQEIAGYVEQRAAKKGDDRTGAILELLDLGMRLEQELNGEWGEIVKRRIETATTEAAVIAELVRTALKRR